MDKVKFDKAISLNKEIEQCKLVIKNLSLFESSDVTNDLGANFHKLYKYSKDPFVRNTIMKALKDILDKLKTNFEEL